jgi:hypothetical protein
MRVSLANGKATAWGLDCIVVRWLECNQVADLAGGFIPDTEERRRNYFLIVPEATVRRESSMHVVRGQAGVPAASFLSVHSSLKW